MLEGKTILLKICHLFALKVFAILIKFLSVDIKPFNISRIVTIIEIASAITIIADVPAPAQTIIIGPSATLGKLCRIIRNGSATLEAKSDHQSKKAIIVPNMVPSKNPTKVS